ncbi:MAG: hypothetical protein K8R21_06345 [Leptospira sp.]|nr:hypothetical protein [Leptospira sp.]
MAKDLETIKTFVVLATIERLKLTYADQLMIKGYDAIPDFLQYHLYCPPNKAERDIVLERLYEKLKTIAGKAMTDNIHQLILLNNLTDSLDTDTAMVIQDSNSYSENGVAIEDLIIAISKVGRFEERRQQIQMVGDALNFFYSLSKLPLIKLVMAPIKVAASMVGATSLTQTMEAGYILTSNIKDLSPFIKIFLEREARNIDDLGKINV